MGVQPWILFPFFRFLPHLIRCKTWKFSIGAVWANSIIHIYLQLLFASVYRQRKVQNERKPGKPRPCTTRHWKRATFRYLIWIQARWRGPNSKDRRSELQGNHTFSSLAATVYGTLLLASFISSRVLHANITIRMRLADFLVQRVLTTFQWYVCLNKSCSFDRLSMTYWEAGLRSNTTRDIWTSNKATQKVANSHLYGWHNIMTSGRWIMSTIKKTKSLLFGTLCHFIKLELSVCEIFWREVTINVWTEIIWIFKAAKILWLTNFCGC